MVVFYSGANQCWMIILCLEFGEVVVSPGKQYQIQLHIRGASL
jgi:hypothetical protein